MSKLLTIGVIAKSRKENENRVAIYPEHITHIPQDVRKQLTFEEGYGLRWGMDDNILSKLTSGRVASREETLKGFDCVLIPKPLAPDLLQMRGGSIVWGWQHCIQQKEITQVSIERKLTLIAWEEMFTWGQTGDKNTHVFYKNNEIAGFAGVNHALSLIGINGYYGNPLKAAVISFGSVSRGAVYALLGQGIRDITTYTSRLPIEVKDQLPGILYKKMGKDGFGNILVVESDGSTIPFADALSDVQIIVNGTTQDIDNPKMFVSTNDADKLMRGTLIIDISCDKGMGFWCAKPTTFSDPLFEVDGKYYYSVDHTPSYYWNSASWEISKAILPFLPIVIGGPKAWEKSYTISKSIEIRNGVIQNPKILSFQHREERYPHNIR
jgi:alanine dehydrogenase